MNNLNNMAADVRQTAASIGILTIIIVIYLTSYFLDITFWEAFLLIGAIYLIYSLLNIIITSVTYYLLLEEKIINYYHSIFITFNFTNPDNYNIDDPKYYLSTLIENQNIDRRVAIQASSILTEIVLLTNLGNFIAAYRIKNAIKKALYRYSDDLNNLQSN